MRALVVYESMFGNTEAVARAVAEGVGRAMPVELLEIGDAPHELPADVALLLVGGPTHGHGMTKPETRADAARRAGDRLVSHGDGIREWLGSLRSPGAAVAAAAFDTRIKGPQLLWGSAAKGASDRLRSLGFRIVSTPHSFLVEGPTGQPFDRLAAGQVDEARSWGEGLATAVGAGAVAAAR